MGVKILPECGQLVKMNPWVCQPPTWGKTRKRYLLRFVKFVFGSLQVLEPISSVYHCRQPQGLPISHWVWWLDFCCKTKCQRIIYAVYHCALHLDVRLLYSEMQVGTFHSHFLGLQQVTITKVRLHTADSRGRPVVTTSSTMEKPPKRNSRWGDLV